MPGTTASSPIRVSDEVRAALAEDLPVLALESTIFTHGLPRPANVETAREAERTIREKGVVPATIGVVGGVPTVGLSDAEIERLSSSDAVVKASVRDLITTAESKQDAGTTIAATALLAHRVGIAVFSTGGLGGVHHGASTTFDESADITSLATTPIVLVSSGAKAILDIGATLERFETYSIPVVGYGTDRYPGFFVQDSGFPVPNRADSPEAIAHMFDFSRSLGLSSAVLVGNPIPEHEQMDPAYLDGVIEQAWAAAEAAQVRGQDATPFLLDFIQRSTGGESLRANIALYRNNVALGCEVARAVSSISRA
ncbi:pseudouridine-5'-phosphate glycosidase [Aeromicrobium piscarium]|uniref:Pseudouridine-5'-phosphate glycosidase n=1 Tax=Aeromicrobium piscarium TaxID=2590901 RepID=A0A554RJH7_9ACTN|nr:pseudouridine-5'-phosphate glycosidase [Aeromicrobium piscarium]TSD54285.1 pseudouridine-5'-phosphate glycosidase [Aeromicrobium piscarium]